MDDMEVVDTRHDPADRLNTREVMVADGFAGMPLWMIGLFFGFFFAVDMVVQGKGSIHGTFSRGVFMCTLKGHAAPRCPM